MEKEKKQSAGIIAKFSKSLLTDKINFLDRMFEEKDIVGLDIGAHSVKAVQLKKKPSGLICTAACYQEIKKPADDSDESRTQQITDAIKSMWQKAKITTNKVRLVISDKDVYSRHISVPRVAEEELSKAIKWQAEKYVPFPIEEAIVDFQDLNLGENDKEGQMEIVIVAAQREIIHTYVSILKNAKLTPTLVNFSPFALANILSDSYSLDEDEIIPVLDVGARGTFILLIKGTSLLLVRRIDCAGDEFTQKVMEAKAIDRSKAEELKKSSPEDLMSICEGPLNELASQITRSLAYCEKDFPTERIKRIVLCGGGAALVGMDKALEKRIGLPFEIAYPFKNIKLDEKRVRISELEGYSSKLMAAVGQAIY